ncbi:twin-arginine translocase subunit TatC [Candidatus Desantisbacteria bacterium]|nr:twin-arginine translocase subunit TatC [Candidatus Desantisbacteria bacterium]
MKNISQSDRMSVIEHIKEIRNTIIISLSVIVISSIIVYQFSNIILKEIIKSLPYAVLFNPLDGLLIHIELAVIFGFIFAFPVVIGELWKFISPGLYKNEKKYILIFSFITACSFAIGAWICYYYYIFPITKWLISIAPPWILPFISVKEYLKFFFSIIFAFGFFFEILPLSFFLSYYQITNAEKMKKYRSVVSVFFILLIINYFGMNDWFILIITFMIAGILYEIIRLLVAVFSKFKI